MIGAARFDEERSELLVRMRGEVTATSLGPKTEGHPTLGMLCAVCGKAFRIGDHTKAVALGVASSADEHALCRGEEYDAIAAEVHEECHG